MLVVYFLSSSSIPNTFPRPTDYLSTSTTEQVAVHDGPPPEKAPSNPLHKAPEVGQGSGLDNTGTTPNLASEFPSAAAPGPRMNATFVTLARNSDIWELARSIRHVEDRFNEKYHYDWVFLNNEEFSEEFKQVTTNLVSGKTHYGLIPVDHWSFPEFIDQEKAAAVREEMKNRKIIYGDSISYRHMCRYESGFFFRHELMNKFEWYWRVEPSIELYCDIDYDPFKFMADNKKKYSFVLSLFEYVETIPTLWDSVKNFISKHPEHIAEGNALAWLSDDGGDTYNHCHFVSSRIFSDKHTDIDSGQTLKLVTWIGSDPRRILTISILLTVTEDSFMKDGVTLLFTPLLQLSCSSKMRSISSMTLPTITFLLLTARLVRISGSSTNAIANLAKILTGRVIHACCFCSNVSLTNSIIGTTKWFDVTGLKKPDGWENEV